MVDIAPLDPKLLFTTLARSGVDFVLIGALAARLQGFPRVTADADITPETSAENLARLATALRGLDARIYTDNIPEGLPFDCTATMLSRGTVWNLSTAAGRIDLVFTPDGTAGYDDLVANAVHFKVFDVDLQVASLQDLIRCKVASDRPQDRQDLIILRAMLDER